VSERVRFERRSPWPGFVELWQDGRELGRAWGRLDGRGQQRVESFETSVAAEKAFAVQVGRLESKRYQAGRHRPDLEATLQAGPNEPGPYLVYADWLLDHGDPRGELIACMEAGAEAEARRLLERHAVQLAPAWWVGWTWPQWRLGFLQRVTCKAHEPGRIRRLLRHPSALVLEELKLMPTGRARLSEPELVLALATRPPTLHTVVVPYHAELVAAQARIPGLVLG
jgi:uncharacterized protein (TIGR02996 family)